MFAGVRELLQRRVGPRRARVGLAVVAAAVLLSSIWNASLVLERMNAAREHHAAFTSAEREEAIERALGFDVAVWGEIRQAVGANDRFLVVSDAFEQHEVRNYAGYLLLPAIQVSDPEDATVVLYWATAPPRDSACVRLADDVCLERRGRA
jgi:hypothetical protein